MESISENQELIQKFMDLLEHHLGESCEVILHDYSKGPMHSIVDIRNGHVTGRSVGGCTTNIGFEILKGTVEAKDEFNYLTYASNGKILRSSSIYFKNSEGKPIGSVCVNLDITQSIQFEKFLNQYNHSEPSENEAGDPKEFFTENVNDLLDTLIERTARKFGQAPQTLSKEEKIQFIAELEAKDVFIITNSSKRICSLLGISKYTFYNYLDIVRKQREPYEKDKMED
ncbi:PAS domain-containing protein [uncultured Oscillibacter sp.]|uniref:helix-turn-helix transcriptional regulator n=1 Tax=uncultured Oscillibacter sp. TaxID=876091 RepID=UPI0028057D5B|nr:PAS domain-containing protein [uncultured Oscillibacter sp.]